MRIYISGKITGTDDYIQRFTKAEIDLLVKYEGVEIINPAVYNQQMPATFTHDEYMTVCMALLSTCDTIYMLKGWETSPGAKAECEYALFNNYKIISEGKKDAKIDKV